MKITFYQVYLVVPRTTKYELEEKKEGNLSFMRKQHYIEHVIFWHMKYSIDYMFVRINLLNLLSYC